MLEKMDTMPEPVPPSPVLEGLLAQSRASQPCTVDTRSQIICVGVRGPWELGGAQQQPGQPNGSQ